MTEGEKPAVVGHDDKLQHQAQTEVCLEMVVHLDTPTHTQNLWLQICNARIAFRPDLGLQWSALLNRPNTYATALYDIIKEDNLHVVMSPRKHPVSALHTQTSRALQQLETFPRVRFQVKHNT